jgi:molybdate transport repressor ModE-like protein
MNMSYKRTWELVADINRSFEEPLVVAQTGGQAGCGAILTERDRELIRHCRAIERKALSATATHLKALQAASRSRAVPDRGREAIPDALLAFPLQPLRGKVEHFQGAWEGEE